MVEGSVVSAPATIGASLKRRVFAETESLLVEASVSKVVAKSSEEVWIVEREVTELNCRKSEYPSSPVALLKETAVGAFVET
jgi:hypothetical protein